MGGEREGEREERDWGAKSSGKMEGEEGRGGKRRGGLNTIGAAERIDERAREWEDGRRPVGENASEEANKRTRSHTVTPILLLSIISVFSTFFSSLFLNQGLGKRWEGDKCSDPFRGACPRRDLRVSPGGVCLVAGSAGHRGPVRKQHCRVRSHLVTKMDFLTSRKSGILGREEAGNEDFQLPLCV